jgi:threonyl-tRNA synthetase
VSRAEAEDRIKAINEPYKLEILEGIKSEPITIYKIGSYSDRTSLMVVFVASC